MGGLFLLQQPAQLAACVQAPGRGQAAGTGPAHRALRRGEAAQHARAAGARFAANAQRRRLGGGARCPARLPAELLGGCGGQGRKLVIQPARDIEYGAQRVGGLGWRRGGRPARPAGATWGSCPQPCTALGLRRACLWRGGVLLVASQCNSAELDKNTNPAAHPTPGAAHLPAPAQPAWPPGLPVFWRAAAAAGP